MSNLDGGITLGTTGAARTFTGFGFTPTHLTFRVGAKSASSSVDQFCYGTVDSTGYMTYTSQFSDTTGAQSKAGTNKCIVHYERVAGVITKVLEADFHSFTSDGFKLNVTTANSSYDVYVEASTI